MTEGNPESFALRRKLALNRASSVTAAPRSNAHKRARAPYVGSDETVINMRSLYRQRGSDAIALAGGCAMNLVAIGKVKTETLFRLVDVQAASGDAGGALGAAF